MIHRILLVLLFTIALPRAWPAPPAAPAEPPSDAIIARVNGEPILLSQLKQSALDQEIPPSALLGDLLRNKAYRRAVTQLIDESLLVQQANAEELKVDERAVAREVEQMLTELRNQFKSEEVQKEFLARHGLTLETLRSILTERERRRALAARVVLKRVQIETVGLDAFIKQREKAGEPTEEVSLSQIVLEAPTAESPRRSAEARALKIAREAENDPERFSQLAREHSVDGGSAERGGYLGWVDPQKLLPELRGQLAGMKPGQISPPIATREGLHIMMLHNRRDARDLLFAEKFTKERNRLATDLRGKANIKLYDLNGNPLTFTPAQLEDTRTTTDTAATSTTAGQP